ncbi:FAD-binding oxidoreductase [Ciceribacter azotifigens]|uniref:FAD-binding oxidoreductase n=1 Tax=Ciceribacter azotifigens TaxID=2069303 RepID=UPI003A83E290
MNFERSTAGLLTALERAVGESNMKRGADVPEAVLRDWSDERGGTPLALVTPRDTDAVAAVLRVCHDYDTPVVPQGGRTGLAGGAVPSEGAVLLSMAGLDRIEEVDSASGLMVVGAGCILQRIQEAALDAGFSFPLDLGARGSCQIGGNIATNAGGNRVIRFGMTRDLVLGLEVVLADGTVLSMMNRMPKNNAALDLKHLFIGSEGTLGVVTRAVLKLHPGVGGANAALVAVADFDAAAGLLRHAQRALSGRVTAFELMWNDYYRAVLAETGVRAPVEPDHGIYALIEMQGADADSERPAFEAMLEAAFEAGLVADAAIAQSQREVEAFWSLRDGIAEILSRRAPTINFDVSVPLARIGACVDEIRAALETAFPALQVIFFGHAGDSNIHLVAGPITDIDPTGHGIETIVYEIIRAYGGSVSAEHGIGLHKKPWLAYSRSENELAMLRQLKRSLDPKGILNPGKVL